MKVNFNRFYSDYTWLKNGKKVLLSVQCRNPELAKKKKDKRKTIST